MIENQKKEILQQRLMKLLRLGNWTGPIIFGAGCFLFAYIIGGDQQPNTPPTNLLTPWLFVGYQIVVWAWVIYLRKTLSVITPTGPRRCFVGNILLAIAGFIFFPLGTTLFFPDLFGFFMGLMTAGIMLLPITQVNRYIKMIYFQPIPTTQSYEESSPCPGMFRVMNTAKSAWALPIFLFVPVFLLLLIIKFCVKDAQVPWEMIWCWAGAFGLGGLIAAVCWSGELWLIKQTATPSAFQRMIRKLIFPDTSTLIFLLYCRRFIVGGWLGILITYNLSKEIVAYKWWLSHPNQPWPENMAELCKHIDTSKFDWQNPKEWPF